jgi:hypothetical protein
MCTTEQRTRVGRKFYPQATIVQFLEEIAKNRSITEICEDPKFPGVTTIYRWLGSDEQFAADYKDAVAKSVKAQ